MKTYVLPTRYEVCALPPDWPAWAHFAFIVEYCGAGKWVVTRHGMDYATDGSRDFAASRRPRSDAERDRFRHTRDQAIALAKLLAPTAKVNQFTVADALRNGPEWQ